MKLVQILPEIQWQSDITIHESCYDTHCISHRDLRVSELRIFLISLVEDSEYKMILSVSYMFEDTVRLLCYKLFMCKNIPIKYTSVFVFFLIILIWEGLRLSITLFIYPLLLPLNECWASWAQSGGYVLSQMWQVWWWHSWLWHRCTRQMRAWCWPISTAKTLMLRMRPTLWGSSPSRTTRTTFESSFSSCSITTRYCLKTSSLVCLFLIFKSYKNYHYCYVLEMIWVTHFFCIWGICFCIINNVLFWDVYLSIYLIYLSGFITAVAIFQKPNAIPLCFSIDLFPNFLLSWLPVLLLSTFFLDVLFSFFPLVSIP